jgi:uncharacterized DUF497 family protein
MFDWDEANIAHIARHNVLQHEAEDILTSNPFDVSYEARSGEIRLRQIGETSEGRILTVISTVRGELTRVVTAYPASPLLQRLYAKHKERMKDGKSNPS